VIGRISHGYVIALKCGGNIIRDGKYDMKKMDRYECIASASAAFDYYVSVYPSLYCRDMDMYLYSYYSVIYLKSLLAIC